MEMNDRAEQAVAYKHGDCNCAQAVLLAFADELGRPEEELRALGSGFGMGMGCTEATCGALCGASIVMGLCNKSGKPTAAIMRELLHEFQEKPVPRSARTSRASRRAECSAPVTTACAMPCARQRSTSDVLRTNRRYNRFRMSCMIPAVYAARCGLS